MKILVIGANGFVGRKALLSFAESGEHEILACSRGEDIAPGKGYEFRRVDLTKEDEIGELIAEFGPEVIINCAAMSVIGQCEKEPESASAVNAEAVGNVARAAEAVGAYIIHLSTDNVFDGRSEVPHKEGDEPCPINVYGRTKLAAEEMIGKYSTRYAILRVVMVYGRSLAGQHSNVIELVKRKVSAGEDFYAVNDQFRMPTYVGDIVEVMHTLVDIFDKKPGEWKEIYNVCGKEKFCIYDIARTVAEVCGIDTSLIHSITTEEQNAGFVRMKYGLLDISKARKELGYHPHSLREALEIMQMN